MPGGGLHPQDEVLFASSQLPVLCAAAADLAFLRQRGYALPGALKLVGDRYQLRERQRTAISRATSEAAGARARGVRALPPGAAAPAKLHLDGFNVVITLETALNRGVLVTTLDGGLRDLAGVHGSYRLGPQTDAALDEVEAALARRTWREVPLCWWLDAPVSNSGRLAARLRDRAQERQLPWTVEVVPDADAVLAQLPADEAAVTSDAVILDRCGPWVDLAAEAVRTRLPEARVIELFPEQA